MSRKLFLGTWTLISYSICIEGSKNELFPYGKKSTGFLIYTDRDVSVHIMRTNRSQKSSSLERKVESAENYGGYVGHYEVQEGVVTHYPKVSSFIDFLSEPQKRNFKFEGDILFLDYSFFDEEKKKNVNAQLKWERLKK